MKNTFKFLFLLLIIFLFGGCSWREYFIIINETETDILVEYELEKSKVGFNNGIFGNELVLNQLDTSNELDWGKTLPIIDKDTTLLLVSCVVPKNTALIFGILSNDRYKHHNQTFINDHVFNLKTLKINHKNKITTITPDNFDDLFVKKNGQIMYKIK